MPGARATRFAPIAGVRGGRPVTHKLFDVVSFASRVLAPRDVPRPVPHAAGARASDGEQRRAALPAPRTTFGRAAAGNRGGRGPVARKFRKLNRGPSLTRIVRGVMHALPTPETRGGPPEGAEAGDHS